MKTSAGELESAPVMQQDQHLRCTTDALLAKLLGNISLLDSKAVILYRQ